MKNIIGILGIGILCLASAGRADTLQKGLTITTNAMSGTFSIEFVRGNQGEIKSMIIEDNGTPSPPLPVKQLQHSPEVLDKHGKYNVITLQLENDFTAQKGGHADIRFLYSGIDGTYKDFRILIDVQNNIILRSDPNPNDPESDHNPFAGQFDSLFLQKHTFLFGKVIGIEKIIPSYN